MEPLVINIIHLFEGCSLVTLRGCFMCLDPFIVQNVPFDSNFCFYFAALKRKYINYTHYLRKFHYYSITWVSEC